MREIVSPLSGIRSPFGQAKNRFLANWFLRIGVWDDAGEWADAAFWNLTWFLSSGTWNDNLYWSDTEAW